MPWNAADRFRAWCAREEESRALTLFRRAFALVWLAYDSLDLLAHGTARAGAILPAGGKAPALLIAGLVACEALLLAEVRPGIAALLCAALRAAEACFYFPLNDFYYYVVTALLLSQAAPGRNGRSPVWVRDALVAQAAWLYLATGILKLSPAWLSGGHLFVRFHYLGVAHDWPYPAFFLRWTSVLEHDAWLAWAGAALEILLGLGLALRAPRRLVLPAAASLHLFAALTTNVWFFGASMVMQVALNARQANGNPPPS